MKHEELFTDKNMEKTSTSYPRLLFVVWTLVS